MLILAIIVSKYLTHIMPDHRYFRLCKHLCPDLSYSHMFGSKGSTPGKFSYPYNVAIDSNGVVYVTDYRNHRVQLFSADGQFILSFGSEGSQHGQLKYPLGICVDSTNTVYVITDSNHHGVSVHQQWRVHKVFRYTREWRGRIYNCVLILLDFVSCT